jgi:hypothetical protein
MIKQLPRKGYQFCHAAMLMGLIHPSSVAVKNENPYCFQNVRKSHIKHAAKKIT